MKYDKYIEKAIQKQQYNRYDKQNRIAALEHRLEKCEETIDFKSYMPALIDGAVTGVTTAAVVAFALLGVDKVTNTLFFKTSHDLKTLILSSGTLIFSTCTITSLLGHKIDLVKDDREYYKEGYYETYYKKLSIKDLKEESEYLTEQIRALRWDSTLDMLEIKELEKALQTSHDFDEFDTFELKMKKAEEAFNLDYRDNLDLITLEIPKIKIKEKQI